MKKEYTILIIFGIFLIIGVIIGVVIILEKNKDKKTSTPSGSANSKPGTSFKYIIKSPKKGYSIPTKATHPDNPLYKSGGVFNCADSIIKGECVFDDEDKAKDYCDQDSKCKGYLTNDSHDPVQYLILRAIPPEGGKYDFQLKVTTQ